MKKRILCMAVLFCIGLCLCGCRAVIGGAVGSIVGSAMEKKDVELLVQGSLDAIYLKKTTPEYLELVGSTEGTEKIYQMILENEANYFANYWCIYNPFWDGRYAEPDAEFQDEIELLLDEIYKYSKFEVMSVETKDDGDYIVEVRVEPIDIMEKASQFYYNDAYKPIIAFQVKYPKEVTDEMSDEEFQKNCVEYGKLIVQMVEAEFPELGYKEAITKIIRVEKDAEGCLAINDTDLNVFEKAVIYYP